MATTQEQAFARLMATPPAICIFGDAKLGKTADAIRTFPTSLVIGPKGGCLPAGTLVGWVPEVREVTDLVEALRICQTSVRKNSGYTALIIDDVSHLARNTKDYFEREGKRHFDLWGAVEGAINALIRYAREQTNIPCILVAHAIPPDYDTKKKPPVLLRKGSPRMPTENLSLGLPGLVDIAVRLECDPTRYGSPHPVSYKAGLTSSPDWITGDRYNIIGDRAPHNMGELLRARVMTVPSALRAPWMALPRAPGMEWMEDWVEQATQQVLAGGQIREVLTEPVNRLKQSCPPWQIVWFIRDVQDRVEIRKLIQSPLSAYGY